MRLVVEVIHVFLEAGRADLHELALAVMLGQVAHHQTLGCVSVDVDEVGEDAIGSKHDQRNNEPVCVARSPARQNRVADDGHDCCQEDVGCDPVQPKTGFAAPEVL